MGLTPERRLRLRIQGLVQGVGFRPHVHRLAHGLQLRGWVRNDHRGVELVVEGPQPQLIAFLEALQRQPPARSRIDRIESRWGAARGEPPGFRIAAATAAPAGTSRAATALITPDLATCPDCLAELGDPSNRRYGYPLISCTHCGPRYSVVERLPFERGHTSLAAFPLCALCQQEYADPADRRFHAQTISCPQCGPRLRWQPTGAAEDSGLSADAAALTAAAAALRQGQIVALQGMGGFQLLVDARNGPAVAELRRRKGRPEKPLALMAPRPWVERHCQLSGPEAEAFNSSVAPILLLRRRSPAADGEVSPEVAGHSPWLGVMRPTSGVHHLLLEAFGGVVVATSANRSGEPLCADASAGGAILAALADGVVSHGLAIVNRIDDSVVRVAAGRPLLLRLGRGHAPCSVALPQPAAATTSPGLALGAQVKGSFALGLGEQALLSPDLGDLGSTAAEQHLRRTQAQWRERHGISPAWIACDRHPGYTSTQLATALAEAEHCPLLPVQHHHAHLLAVLAEHGLEGPELGVAWDGSGLGDDGSLWGGEGLRVSRGARERVAMLRPFRLPGGEQALREPRRAALGLLVAGFGEHWRERTALLPPASTPGAFTAEELSVLEVALGRALQSPLCSSVGRLFDAVASLLGLQQRCSYEAQAALALEAVALQAVALEDVDLEDEPPWSGAYAIALRAPEGPEPWQLDWQPLLEQLLADLSAGVPSAAIALAFHRALASAIGDLAAALGASRFVLSGGCFQNQLLLESSIAALRRRGIEPLWPRQLPCNDAALPIGQLLAL
jgi:hydrogenase maturation protein HypF